MGLFMWRPILKNFMQDCSLMLWDHKFINASNFRLYVCGASSVGFRDPGTLGRRCILQQASLGRSVDETRWPRDQPKSAPASRIRRLFLGASLRLSPHDAELLVLGATQEL